MNCDENGWSLQGDSNNFHYKKDNKCGWCKRRGFATYNCPTLLCKLRYQRDKKLK